MQNCCIHVLKGIIGGREREEIQVSAAEQEENNSIRAQCSTQVASPSPFKSRLFAKNDVIIVFLKNAANQYLQEGLMSNSEIRRENFCH